MKPFQDTFNKAHWESTLKELTMLAEKFPSRRLYEQIAQCYCQLDEYQEADVIMDMAKYMPKDASPVPEQTL